MSKFARWMAGICAMGLLTGCAQPTPTPLPTQVPAPPPLPTSQPTSEPTRTALPAPTPTRPPEPTRATARAGGPTATPGPAPTPMIGDHTLVITLKSGQKWSDGALFVARDVVGTYDILWAMDDPIWQLLRDVRVVDDRTVAFDFQIANVWAQDFILRGQTIAPVSQYGWLMEMAADMRANLVGVNSSERQGFLSAMERYNPITADVVGPYRPDPEAITATVLMTNPAGYAATQMKFDRIQLSGGSAFTAAVLFANGQLDYAPAVLPSATMSELKSLPGVFAPASGTGVGMGLWLNHARDSLGRKEVRQALAYSINRQMALSDTLGAGAAAAQYLVGFADALAPQYLPTQVISGLNAYTPDLDRAAVLLVTQGFTRGSDKLWRDAKGNPLALVLTVPQEYTDLLAVAENIRQQLNAAGWSVSVKPTPAQDMPAALAAGNFDMMLGDIFHGAVAHPAAALGEIMAGVANAPTAPPGRRGMAWAWQQKAPGLPAPVDVPKTLAACADGFGMGKQNPACVTLAQIFNDQLPALPLGERRLTDLVNTQGNALGWAAPENPVWRQNALTGNAVAAQILAGSLKPGGGNSARQLVVFQPMGSAAQYSRNPFHANFVGNALGPVAAPLVYPPLFWFNAATFGYQPMLAEKYEFK